MGVKIAVCDSVSVKVLWGAAIPNKIFLHCETENTVFGRNESLEELGCNFFLAIRAIINPFGDDTSAPSPNRSCTERDDQVTESSMRFPARAEAHGFPRAKARKDIAGISNSRSGSEVSLLYDNQRRPNFRQCCISSRREVRRFPANKRFCIRQHCPILTGRQQRFLIKINQYDFRGKEPVGMIPIRLFLKAIISRERHCTSWARKVAKLPAEKNEILSLWRWMMSSRDWQEGGWQKALERSRISSLSYRLRISQGPSERQLDGLNHFAPLFWTDRSPSSIFRLAIFKCLSSLGLLVVLTGSAFPHCTVALL